MKRLDKCGLIMEAPEFLVSVVIPCYNVEAYVEDAVTSTMQQTYSRLEVICVDDGSSDHTLSKLRLLEAQYPDKMKVITGPNKGASAARNKGLSASSGEYIQFLDSDDLLSPEKIERQVTMLSHDSEVCDLVVGAYKKVFLNGTEQKKVANQSDPWAALFRSQLGITSSNLWRRSAVVNAGGWSESQASSQEAELMFRMLKNGAAVGFDSRFCTILRQREGSISNSRQGDNWKRYINLRTDMLQYLKSQSMLTSERERAAFQSLFQAIRSLYSYEPEHAMTLYQKYIPSNYEPMQTAACTPLYLFLFSMLGFERAERVRALLRRIR